MLLHSWIIRVCPNTKQDYPRSMVSTMKHLWDLNQTLQECTFSWVDVIDYRGWYWISLRTRGTPEAIRKLAPLNWTSLNDLPLLSSHRWYRRIQNARYLHFDFDGALEQEEEELRSLRESESQD